MIWSTRALAAGGLLLGLALGLLWAGPEDAGFLDELQRVETACGPVCPYVDPTTLSTQMSALEERARAFVSAAARVEALNRLVFEHLGIKPSQDLKDPDNLILSRVLDRKQGYCVGIASLYLVIADRLRLPIYAVATPSHVFLRYDDGTTRINIETLQQGANVPDEQYVRGQKIPQESIARGVFMRNLTADEFLAQVHNNLGVIYSERKDYEHAASEYEAAFDLDPHFPAPYYNFGNDLLARGDFRRAKRLFSRSLRLYPADVWALNNRGLAYLKMEKREKARRDFEAALRIDPGFEPAKRNLEGVQRRP